MDSDGWPACATFTIDSVAPQTTIDAGPASPTNDPIAEFSFSSSEAMSTFRCRLDSATLHECSSPHVTLPLRDGPHRFCVEATDAATITDLSADCEDFAVYTAAPQTTIN